MTIFRRGDAGPAVAEIRDRLVRLHLLEDRHTDGSGSIDDAVFDDDMDAAVRHFQQQSGLTADGIVGPQTFRRLEEARWQLGDRLLTFQPSHLLTGDDVAELQRRLIQLGFDAGRVDGVFGKRTDKALREFQRNVGLAGDGVFGPGTFKAIQQLKRSVVGGRPQYLREEHAWESTRTGVADKVVVIDPGHGGPQDLGCAAEGIYESDLVLDIASRVEGRLAALGVTVLMTRSASSNLPTSLDQGQRAAFANETGADVVISLHIDRNVNSSASGVAGFYYGNDALGTASAMGHRLADVLVDEISTRTDLANLHTHSRTWDLLRMTRMTAVRLELGYLTSPHDRSLLVKPTFRDGLAEAIAEGLIRFFSPATLPSRHTTHS